jgi:hypothetical protein
MVSSVSNQAHQAPAPVQASRPAPVDADGDHDGTKVAAKPAPQAQISKPTATMGNHVNTVA